MGGGNGSTTGSRNTGPPTCRRCGAPGRTSELSDLGGLRVGLGADVGLRQGRVRCGDVVHRLAGYGVVRRLVRTGAAGVLGGRGGRCRRRGGRGRSGCRLVRRLTRGAAVVPPPVTVWGAPPRLQR